MITDGESDGMSESSSTIFSSDDDPSLGSRSSFWLWAFCSLVLGFFSLLSLLGQTWWICGGLGFLGSTLIMIHINRHDSSLGVRLIATGGLWLSLLVISYAPTQFYLRQRAICQQAALLGNDWLKNILMGNPIKSIVALQAPETRIAQDQMQTFYLQTPEGKREYEQFKKNKLIKSLMTLNGRARSQFYDTESMRVEGDQDIIVSLFSISYLETPLKRKTFFVRLVFKHSSHGTSSGQWSILRYRGGVRPRNSFFSKSVASNSDP